MKTKQQKIQLVLILSGVLLFSLTYLYYPKTVEKKILEEQSLKTDEVTTMNSEETTVFKNIEYKGLYNLKSPFKIKSKSAYISNKNTDIVYMKNMHVILNLADGRMVEITSLQGRYNKSSYDCFFEKDIIATDGDTIITAENLDLLASKRFVEIYNEVNLKHSTGNLRADKINYDFESKHFNVSMFDDKSIIMKLIQ